MCIPFNSTLAGKTVSPNDAKALAASILSILSPRGMAKTALNNWAFWWKPGHPALPLFTQIATNNAEGIGLENLAPVNRWWSYHTTYGIPSVNLAVNGMTTLHKGPGMCTG